MTPEEIKATRELAQRMELRHGEYSNVGTLARAVRAVTEQPEQVSRSELVHLFNRALPIDAAANFVIDLLLSRYDITARKEESDRG